MIYHSMANSHRHTIHMDLDLLTSNGLIIKSRYYDFNDTTCIVNVSV